MVQKWVSRFEIRPGVYVFVPTEETTEIGKEIKRLVEARWHAPRNYYHLRAGGHVRALRVHTGNTVFARLDIEGFFASISRTRVTRELKGFFGYDRAREFANAATVPTPGKLATVLPFGFVTSPLLASLCLCQSALGRCLRELTPKYGVTVSVYVDDIVLSSNSQRDLEAALADIEVAAARSRFRLSDVKREGPAASITAFNIELTNQSLRIEPRRWTQFINTYSTATSDAVRDGVSGYVRTVNGMQASML